MGESGWEARAEVGAEVDASGHGLVSLGARRGPWSVELLTDTLDARWSPEGERGRAWLAARAELGVAGLWPSRWADGARAPGLDRLAFYEGVEGGALRWLPGGLYAGVAGAARWWHFAALPTSVGPIEEARPVGTADAVVGWWRPVGSAYARLGADLTTVGQGLQPHAHARADTSLPWRVRPDLVVAAGVADGQDDVTRTRLGGLNPFTVPLAGANWGEHWVEDYAVARVGLEAAPGPVVLGARTDLAWFDRRSELGLSADAAWRDDEGRFAEVSVGWSPTLERVDTVPLAVWVRAGLDWGRGLGLSGPRR